LFAPPIPIPVPPYGQRNSPRSATGCR
jgi:hypothetical protein